MFEDAIPSNGMFNSLRLSITAISTSLLVRGSLEASSAWNTSTITSLESPGCNSPTDKHNFRTNSLFVEVDGCSYFLRVISASGVSFTTNCCLSLTVIKHPYPFLTTNHTYV